MVDFDEVFGHLCVFVVLRVSSQPIYNCIYLSKFLVLISMLLKSHFHCDRIDKF